MYTTVSVETEIYNALKETNPGLTWTHFMESMLFAWKNIVSDKNKMRIIQQTGKETQNDGEKG